MKKNGISTALLAMLLMLAPLAMQGQNKTFEKISKLPETQYAYISQAMLSSMATMLDSPAAKFTSAVDHLKSLEVITCSSPSSFEKIHKLLDPWVTSELQLYSKVKDNGENIEIYCTRNGDKLSSLLLITDEPEEISAVYMTGDIDPDTIKSMTKPSN